MMEYAFLFASSVFLRPVSSALQFSVVTTPYGAVVIPLLFTICFSIACGILRHFRCHSIESDSSLACKIMKNLGQGKWTRVFEYDHVQGDDRPTVVISVWPFAVAKAKCDQSDSGAKKVNARLWCFDSVWRALNVDDCAAAKLMEEKAANEKNDKTFVISKLVKNIENQYAYYSRVVSMFYYNICADSDQQAILDKIVAIYNSRKQCCAFIEGPPGTGKSSIASLLCVRLNGVLCPFDPTRPGESFDEIKAASENLCGDKVLVILMDEVDVMIRAVRNERVEQNVYTRTIAKNKPGWNGLMDQLGSERGIVVIMTSNTPKRRLDEEETRTNPLTLSIELLRQGLRRVLRGRGKAVPPSEPKQKASNFRAGRVHAVFRCSTKPNPGPDGGGGYIHDVEH